MLAYPTCRSTTPRVSSNTPPSWPSRCYPAIEVPGSGLARPTEVTRLCWKVARQPPVAAAPRGLPLEAAPKGTPRLEAAPKGTPRAAAPQGMSGRVVVLPAR